MRERMQDLARRAAGWCGRNPERVANNALFGVAFGSVCYGLWLWHEPMAFVLPGTFVCGSMIAARILRGGRR